MTSGRIEKDADIDPYYKWLGIPPALRPPTYFDLLGLPSTENDHETIKIASKKQKTVVDSFRGGEHEEWAARLSYEIDEATICLLDPKVRLEYRKNLSRVRRRRKVLHGDVKETVPAYIIRQAIGEESGIVREFRGVMFVILSCILISLVVSFMIPWGNPPQVEKERPGVQQTDQQGAQQKPVKKVVIPRPNNDDQPSLDKGDEELAVLQMKIVDVDVSGRALTVSRKGKETTMDISKNMKVLIDGESSSADTLQTGMDAEIHFNAEYDVVMQVEVTNIKSQSSVTEFFDDNNSQSGPGEYFVVLEMKIVNVDLPGHALTVNRKGKEAVMDISKNAKILIGGKVSSAELLKSGMTAEVHFDAEYDIVAKVDVINADSSSLETETLERV